MKRTGVDRQPPAAGSRQSESVELPNACGFAETLIPVFKVSDLTAALKDPNSMADAIQRGC